MTTMRITLVLALCTLGLPLLAAEPLALDDAIATALAQNPSQAAARERVAAAYAAIERARADRRPAVDLVGGVREFETHAFLPSGLTPPDGSSTIGPTDDWSIAVEGRWLLYDSGRGGARVDVARATHAASEHQFASAQADLVFAVHTAWRTYEASLAAREAAASRVERSADHLRLAQSRLDAGASPRADVTRARVEQANARAALAAREGDVRVAAATLNTLLGRPAEEPIAIEANARGALVAGDLESSIRSALEQRPELLAARKRLAARKAEIALAASTSGFTADLRARYGVRDEDVFPSDRDTSIGITISRSLFDGGREKAEVARARAEARAEESAVTALENEIRQRVVEAHARLVEMRARTTAAEAARLEAAEGVRLTRARYEAGAAPIGDLLDAASELEAAEAADVGARASLLIATARLAHARGELVPRPSTSTTEGD